MTTYKHISLEERKEIAYFITKGYSLRKIAGILRRSVSSISREVKRNWLPWWPMNDYKSQSYDPNSAKVKARERRRRSKYQWMKVQGNSKLRLYITQKLLSGWTPDMIAWRLKHQPWEEGNQLGYVSTKGIYKWLYSSWWQSYCQCLPSMQTKPKRRMRWVKKKKREMIPDRVSISQRPDEANSRSEVWHWEADTIVSGKKTGSKVALCTMVDRKSRYTRIRRIENLRPDSMNEAILSSMRWLPCHTITYDNGIENKRHMIIVDILCCLTFFCHPYHSWEKGTNENTNGRIRRYIPKWDNIGRYSHAEVQEIENWLNHTPRKCLNYKTPYEVMLEGIQSDQSNVENSPDTTLLSYDM